MLSIRAERKRVGLTQHQLAKLMGVSDMAVSLWERGTFPATRRLRKLATILGCTVDDLIPPDQDA